MSKALQIGNAILNAAIPDQQNSSNLTFRKFNGDDLANYALNIITEIPKNSITKVVLLINPESISYSEPKITQKVQTTAPGRFIIYDWGTDLLSINITGNTGNLLPESITNRFDLSQSSTFDIMNKIANIGGKDLNQGMGPITNVTNVISSFMSKAVIGSMTYDEIIRLGKKWQAFQDLRDIYRSFDADRDILTMELGMNVYRIFFSSFSFDHNAISPWNYKYKIDVIALEDLSKIYKKNSKQFNSTNID